MNFPRKSARLIAWLVAWLACAPFFLCAQAEPGDARLRVAICGFQRPAGMAVAAIPGAQSTQLAAARATEKGGLELLSQEAFDALGLDWAAFQSTTAKAASAELSRAKVEWIRDHHEVIECAILRAASPGGDITPAILAPDFLQRFTPVFGRKVLVAIPERGTVFLFPRLASHYQDYAARVLAVYCKSKTPVSPEVLELSATGLRAIGTYEQ